MHERRRAGLLLFAVAIGLAPETILTLMVSAFPAFATYAMSPQGRPVIAAITGPPMLAIPFITMYAVLVHRVLNVQLVLRQALQYALARRTVRVLVASPFVVVLALMYLQREQPVAELWSGSMGVVFMFAVGSGAVMSRLRQPILQSVDRRFFREQYDAHRILSDLVERTRIRQAPDALATAVAVEIDRALHLRLAELLLLDRSIGAFTSPRRLLRPLGVGSRLARRLEENAAPLEVDWARPRSWSTSLPETERQWLADVDARLLVPVLGATGALLGVLVLGEKRSELPFSREDRRLLATIAGSIALAAEPRLLSPGSSRTIDGTPALDEQPARECLGCGMLSEPDKRRCASCGDSTVPAAVPLVLAGKFHLLQKVGRGGMGVVYRANDLSLDREVAIKTLPAVDAAGAVRLRAEARAMAAVSHPNLALIYGAESWEGIPMLVVEFLGGGTVADRLLRQRVSLDHALEVGRTLAHALASLHAVGILHRDIKPSNVGYTSVGVPKLLDFGLARVLEAAQTESVAPQWRSFPSSIPWTSLTVIRSDGATTGILGTPLYLSPEAVRGLRPDVRTDLWALCMVLYEMIAGHHPFEEETLESLVPRISRADLPDIRNVASDVPASVAEYFHDALHSEPARRPASALELGRRLTALQRQLVSEPSA